MQAVLDFIKSLGTEYLSVTIICILALVVIIFALIVGYRSIKKEKAEQKKEHFRDSTLESLTDEAIIKISKNAADPEEVKMYLTTEVNDVRLKKSNTKTTKKPKKQTAETAKASKSISNNNVNKTKNNSKKEATKTVEQTKTIGQKSKKVEQKNTDDLKTKSNSKNSETKSSAIIGSDKVEQNTVNAQPSKKVYLGRWKICQEDDGFIAILTASNGGMLLKTEKYKSLSSVKNGIETIKKNVDGGNFAISIDKYGHYRFKLFNVSNRLICVSEDYSSKSKCESGIESVKRFAKTATIIQEENK